MSELKAHRFITTDELFPEANAGVLYYEKSEADKVIADLKRVCKDKDDWCIHTLKELRHNKYKRCLAMAEMCSFKAECFDQYARHTYYLPSIEKYRRKRNHYADRCNKLLFIAENLKEAK